MEEESELSGRGERGEWTSYFWQIFGQQIILEGHYRNLRHHFFCVFSNSVFVYM